MKHSKSSLFLMELIIALLFFSMASTVCIRLFINAHTLSRQTVRQNYAVNYAQNMAEIFIGCDGDLQAMQTILPDSTLSEDGNWLVQTQNGYHIQLERSGTPTPGSMISADIRVYMNGAVLAMISSSPGTDVQPPVPLYTLQVELYIPYVK